MYYYIGWLFGFFDGGSAAEGCVLVTEVYEVGVVNLDIELRLGHAFADELFLDTVYAVPAQALVDFVITGIVVCPSGDDVLLVGVVLHYAGYCFKQAYVLLCQTEDVDGVVDGGQRSFFDHGLGNGLVEAILELVFKVFDAVVGGLEACTVCIAVFRREDIRE